MLFFQSMCFIQRKLVYTLHPDVVYKCQMQSIFSFLRLHDWIANAFPDAARAFRKKIKENFSYGAIDAEDMRVTLSDYSFQLKPIIIVRSVPFASVLSLSAVEDSSIWKDKKLQFKRVRHESLFPNFHKFFLFSLLFMQINYANVQKRIHVISNIKLSGKFVKYVFSFVVVVLGGVGGDDDDWRTE